MDKKEYKVIVKIYSKTITSDSTNSDTSGLNGSNWVNARKCIRQVKFLQGLLDKGVKWEHIKMPSCFNSGFVYLIEKDSVKENSAKKDSGSVAGPNGFYI
jgi:hypothetical protein